MDIELDDEEKASRICGCIDAVSDLLSGQHPDFGVDAKNLVHLMRLIGEEAHRLLDIKDGPRRPRPVND
ncbi:hypothetical protein GG804_25645 [Sphingomonas histidinilytica]|uniref:hypothetical protein n=1 Tax=Rhizorhabdus histidinilytica TaxID=439228 RepID=UPI001ADCD7B0|nr:hypothetical protein [Rhizorhabdus histidinilytica]MBO9380156.1 hypothetical protein [Rhizorhabdus histidinilytica]